MGKKKNHTNKKEIKKKNIIARHKLLFTICLLAFIVLIMLLYIFFSLFIGGNDPYGDRLKEVSKVQVSEKEKKDIVNMLKEKEEVSNASVRVQGKIIYVHIKVKEGVDLNKGKEIADESLEKFKDEEKKIYDIGFFLSEDKDGGFIVTGTKSAKSEKIVWIKS